MKNKIILKFGLAVILLVIIWMKWQEHSGLVHPDKPAWKVVTTGDFANLDTALANFYQLHSLVHPKTLVWKEFTLDDSANNNQKTVR